MVFNCKYQEAHRGFAICNGFPLKIAKKRCVFLLFSMVFLLKIPKINRFFCYFELFSTVNAKKPIGFLLFSMVFYCKHQGSRLRARQNNACNTTKCIIQAWENAFARFPDYRLVYGS